MKDPKALIIQLEQRGIRLKLRNGELIIQAPKGILTADIQADIRHQKKALIDFLANPLKTDFKPPPISAMDFSLFFFGNQNQLSVQDNYALLFQAADFADKHDFSAIWTPERHFNPLGGPFPNPALLAAALAMKTQNLKLRAGSVVLPLQDPLRVAEDWAVVDQLSKGRVELSFASGWHANDFVLAPEHYTQRQEKLFQNLDILQTLWQGEAIQRADGGQQVIAVKTFPQPFQANIPLWLTAIGNPDSYRRIGARGAHLLTCLLDQDIDELATKIKGYRQALAENGHDPKRFKVAVFMHAYLGDDLIKTKEEVKAPLQTYLKSTLNLLGKLSQSVNIDLDPTRFNQADQQTLLDFAFERYFEGRALMGDTDQAQKLIIALQQADVQEIACLIDFGMTAPQALHSLKILAGLVQAYTRVSNG